MKMKHKSFPLKIEIKEDPANPGARTIEGWASTFGNVDSGNDIILPGAFAESLLTRKPKMLWQHNSDQPCGVWDTATETDQGLYVKGRILDTTLGNDAYILAKEGAIDSMSIGYSTIDAVWDYETGVRTLKKLELWEVSLVTFPMNERATITGVKGISEDMDAMGDLLERANGICQAYVSGEMTPTPEMIGTVMQLLQQAQAMLEDADVEEPDDKGRKHTPKTLERFLREAGLTRGEARGLLAKGYSAITEQREAVNEPPSELALLFKQFR